MLFESLEIRRLLTVTLRPAVPPSVSGDPGTQAPDCITVTQDRNGNVTIGTKDNTNGHHGFKKSHQICQWFRDGRGRWCYGHTSGHSSGGSSRLCGGSSTTNQDCTMGVSVMEDHGTLVVTEISTGATWDVTNARSVTINGTDNADDIFYTGNSIGANISGNGGDDSITIADIGSGSSNADGGSGNDSLNLLMGNYTHLYGGSGDDTIYVNSGAGQYDVAHGEAIVDAGTGNDTIVVYAGHNTVMGGSGNDNVLEFGGTTAVSSATVTHA